MLPPRDISESSGCCEGAAARKIIDGHTLHVSCVTDLIERSISIIEHCILRRGRCAELGLDSLAKARMRGHLPVDRHIEMAIVIKPCLQRLHHVLEHEPVLSWQRINKGKIITAFARAFSPEIRQRRTSHVRCTPSIARPLEHTHARGARKRARDQSEPCLCPDLAKLIRNHLPMAERRAFDGYRPRAEVFLSRCGINREMCTICVVVGVLLAHARAVFYVKDARSHSVGTTSGGGFENSTGRQSFLTCSSMATALRAHRNH